jgi:hypothetical protein
MNDTSPNSDNTQKRPNAGVLPSYETANFVTCGPNFQRLKTHVQQLCKGVLHALYVCGAPGTFKLMAIKHELHRLKQKYVECSAPLSAEEMIDVLKKNPRKCILITHSSLLHHNPEVVSLVLQLVTKSHTVPVTNNNSPEWFCPVRKFTGSLIFMSDFPFGEDTMAEYFNGEEILKVHYPTDDEIDDCLEAWAERIVESKSDDHRQAVLLWLKATRSSYVVKQKYYNLMAMLQDFESKMVQSYRDVQIGSDTLASIGATLFQTHS